jgi:hypothetical protein
MYFSLDDTVGKRDFIKHSMLFCIVALALAPQLCLAQQPSVNVASLEAAPESRAATATTSVPATGSNHSLTERWLDLTTFSHSQRYRNQYTDDGYHYFEDGQERSVLAGKIKLDAEEKYAIGFRFSTGRTFNWSYSDFAGQGFAARLKDPNADSDIEDPSQDPVIAAAAAADPVGLHEIQNIQSTGWQFYPRELYLRASPSKHIVIEAGSFGIERGLSTEITTFDDDGYIAGERVRIKDPRHLFFDEVTATSAYFGDFYTPNLFERGSTFTKSNYRQVAARKQLTPRIGISAEYNWISLTVRTNTTRQAIVVNTKESRIVDKVRLEGYERLSHVNLQGDDNAPRQGFALVGQKAIGKFSGDFGVASIDRDYGMYGGSRFAQEVGFSFNGDNYNVGIRVLSHLNYKITPAVTAFGFYTRITGDQFANINRQGLNTGLTFDLKALTNSRERVF